MGEKLPTRTPACAQLKAALIGGCSEPRWWGTALGTRAPHTGLSVPGEGPSAVEWGQPCQAGNFRVELQAS